ncbi:hypothetical protein B0H13DRAFT_2669541 [Mycena leptocephala]|nr:hypothetical protein B0H13DRAFT_2669541 [Mycena leptocephala]
MPASDPADYPSLLRRRRMSTPPPCTLPPAAHRNLERRLALFESAEWTQLHWTCALPGYTPFTGVSFLPVLVLSPPQLTRLRPVPPTSC